ncbi:kelch repeat-containing protein [Ferrimonas sp. SCSIO 43195]|uniref:Kelch repeat-containing protein n=1 Tax=Ferrimonas sp. SCSIO 43195 TaxID=2822844 RepID=UPI002074DE4C|nr:kelch repeat-containing protein [Ferrimonas sp. SCSIO 43195]USD37910.1 galactose oxidase [Ferrimonas sp. SCSIO 43195]
MSLFALLLATAPLSLPPMPEPVSNNAVAGVHVDGRNYLLSFNGLGSNKDHRDVHNRAWALALDGVSRWQSLAPVPGPGRLASVAVGIGESAYVFGGYTVAADHSEVSLADVWRFDVASNRYTALAPMPVPVDDAVAVAYQQRYLYLISGWHNDGNVNLVQLYDTHTDRWQQASPYPGTPVFGHAGALAGNSLVVCDGAKVVYHESRRRSFAAEPGCYRGEIDADNPARIDWRQAAHHSGVARYRMAAIGLPERGELWFIGGTETPYNYDGTGYDGIAARPSDRISVYELASDRWRNHQDAVATMDHRGALKLGQQLLILGGMGPQQRVLNTVRQIPLSAPNP